MSEAKTFVYKYDDLNVSEEVETDLTGDVPVPRVGDLLLRKNKAWKVMGVYPALSTDLPRYRLLLMAASWPN